MKNIVLVFISILTFFHNVKAQKIPYNQVTSIQSYNYRTAFIRHRDGLGFAEQDGISSELDKKDATFKIVPGLYNPQTGYISFESANYPNYFFRHSFGRLILVQREDNDLFMKDATFRVVTGLADARWISFESVNYAGYFLRHKNGELWVEQNDGSPLFQNDATWQFSTAWW